MPKILPIPPMTPKFREARRNIDSGIIIIFVSISSNTFSSKMPGGVIRFTSFLRLEVDIMTLICRSKDFMWQRLLNRQRNCLFYQIPRKEIFIANSYENGRFFKFFFLLVANVGGGVNSAPGNSLGGGSPPSSLVAFCT